jgi:two-component system response regulator MprA
VLVVEDDESIRGLVSRVLAGEGYRVVTAEDGAVALELLGRGTVVPGLILLDWGMPTPGAVFARAYRALPAPPAPLVVLTAGADGAAAAEEAGACGLLCKPFDLDDLVDTVRRFLGPAADPAPTSAAEAPHAAAAPAVVPVAGAGGAAGGAARDRRLRPRVLPPGRRIKDPRAAEAQRRARLRRLGDEVAALRASIEAARSEVLTLLAVEQTRRLSAAETARVRPLRWESERLRGDLAALRERFEQLRSRRASSS